MQYIDLKTSLKDFLVFSIRDIKKIEPDFHSQRLSEWQNKGYIKKITKEFYIFSELAIDETVLFLIANKIYSPSYISLEMALSNYNLIPEGVYSVTSVSTRKTEKFKTPVAEFSYRRLKPELFFGYRLAEANNQQYKISEIEKTVLDYLYLNPQMSDEAAFFEWRFNGEEFLAQADLVKFSEYLKMFKNKQLTKRAEKFLMFIKKK